MLFNVTTGAAPHYATGPDTIPDDSPEHSGPPDALSWRPEKDSTPAAGGCSQSVHRQGLAAREALTMDTYMPKLLSIIVLAAITALAGFAIEWDRRRTIARLPMRSHALRNRGVR
jgi:hypothetical protein